jgi:two-component system, chemotaxis family, sensor kinase CheA
MDDLELIHEFLIESNENLARLDQEIVELEQRPRDANLLGSVFRTFHTLKGTCGFLAFSKLERITHAAETILSQLREGERTLNPALVSLILETIDAVKAILQTIEATHQEGSESYEDLRLRLDQVALDLSWCGPEAASQRDEEPTPDIPENVEVPLASFELPEPVCPASTQPELAIAPGSPVDARPELFDHLPVQALATAEPRQTPLGNTSEIVPPPVASKETEVPASEARASVTDSTIRVDVGLLEKLMNLVGELVLARNQIIQFSSMHTDAAITASSQRLNLITTELQENVMKTRMQPIGTIWGKLPRVVRDVAAACGKQVQVVMEGAETELDRTVIEAIKDPLTHIVRNSCDHGIETPEHRKAVGKPAAGKLFLRAFHEGGNVNIEIVDDGAGVDLDRVRDKALRQGLITESQANQMSQRELSNLIFVPGFSTARQVSAISGRGVGMDVVRTNIEKIGGFVELFSRKGHGTTIKIKIPLTLAIIPGLVVTSAAERFVIPQVNLVELIRVEGSAVDSQIEEVHGCSVYRRRGKLLPLLRLNQALQLEMGDKGEAVALNIVVLQAESQTFGLVVDEINDTQEIVVKPLGKHLKGLNSYAAATIMGDGRVALILDVNGFALQAGTAKDNAASRPVQEERNRSSQTLLLFRAGGIERLAVPLDLVARLEVFSASQIEKAGGQMVVQYRGELLHLVSLTGEFSLEGRDQVEVVVFGDGKHQSGLVVEEILDIVDDEIRMRLQGGRPGILGSAVVAGRVTDFLDVQSVLSGCRSGLFSEHPEAKGQIRILLADPSPFSRAALRGFLEMNGFVVTEASSGLEALERCSREKQHIILAAYELASSKGFDLANRLRVETGVEPAPVIALTDGGIGPEEGSEGFAEHKAWTERESMLRSIERLAMAVSKGAGPLRGVEEESEARICA